MTPEEKKGAKRLYDIEYRKNNKIAIAKYKQVWYENNPTLVAEAANRNKEGKKKSDKKYAKANKAKLNKKKKSWAKANPNKIKKAKSDYVKRKMSEDKLYRLKHNISCSIRQSFKRNGYTKNAKAYDILGCTFDEFKRHLESKFESWMNWGNYGNPNGIITEQNKTWDIDHIIPISSAKTEDDVIKLNHYTNLQPLCSYTNRWIKKDSL